VMTEMEPGRYRLGGSHLSLAGRWRIDIAVRRKGMEDSVAKFDWTVSSPSQVRPVVLSNRPLEPLLTFAAALAMIGVLLAAVWIWLTRRRVARWDASQPVTLSAEE